VILAGNAGRSTEPRQEKPVTSCRALETLEHTFAVEASLLELWRVCADGGFVVITVPNSIAALPLGLLTHALGLDQRQVLLSYHKLRRLIRQTGFRPVDEYGTNFFRDMILNDVLPESWRRLASKFSELAATRMRREVSLWKVTAGTLGFLLHKEHDVAILSPDSNRAGGSKREPEGADFL
jgi:hypothetical protein